jgi:prephenate dehydrogenase
MTKNKKTIIGIIGTGKFGGLIKKILSKNFEKIIVFKKNSRLEKLAKCDLVIPAVPISAFESILKKINPYLKEGSILADVCSVKIYPAELMKKSIKKEINLLATHPMWGPDSYKSNNLSLNGLKIVLYPLRISNEKYSLIKVFLKKLGLKIIEISPDEHDRQAAKSQAIVQFVGKTLQEMPAEKIPIATLGYEQLLKILPFTANNTEELFYSLQNFNPYSKNERKKFLNSAIKINKKINEHKNFKKSR